MSNSELTELEKAEREYDLATERYELAATKKARDSAKIEILYARARYFENLEKYTSYYQNWR